MFDRRLRVLLTVFGVALAVIVVRLGQLQVVQASYYREQAERAVFDRPAALAFVRGGISDRTGEVLVRDEARWDLTVDYSVIAADGMRDAAVMLPLAKRWERRGFLGGAPSEEGLIEALCGRLDATWRQIAFFANDRDTTVGALRERAAEIHGRVTAIREAVSRRRGFDARVAEETHPHPILTALSAERQVEARERLADFPWVHLEPAAVRQFVDDGAAFAHVLGRVGRVTAEDVGADPNADDPFAAYRGDEVRGITGIEWVAEQRLRGRRGQLVHDREGRVVETEYFAPQNGEDLTLTIHAGLQRRLYRLLEEAVQRVPASSGGAIVVVDVPTREVLALVSYPAYDPNQFEAVYADQLITRAPGIRMPAASAPTALVGLSVCFTGESICERNGVPLTRSDAEQLAVGAGLTVAVNVTKRLDILVLADPDSMSGKAQKARRYGVRLMAERVFWQQIGVEVD